MKKLRTKCLFVVFAACLAACSNDDATLNLIKGKEVASLETTNPVVESALKFVTDIQKEEQHIAGTRSNLHALHVSKIDSVTVSSINSSITRTAKGDNTSLPSQSCITAPLSLLVRAKYLYPTNCLKYSAFLYLPVFLGYIPL